MLKISEEIPFLIPPGLTCQVPSTWQVIPTCDRCMVVKNDSADIKEKSQ